jgi:alkylhydroperoxidase/carboxymuconolactone decarboxylase family protein YurZ
VAREDPEYVKARQPLSQLSIGEGRELSVKYREMVIIGILAFRGRKDGVIAHMRRAIDHGATKRELLEAIQSAGVPGGGPTFSTGAQALMQLDRRARSRPRARTAAAARDGAGPRGCARGSAPSPPRSRSRVPGAT